MGHYCGTADRDSGTAAQPLRVQYLRISKGGQHPQIFDNHAGKRRQRSTTDPAAVTRVVMAVTVTNAGSNAYRVVNRFHR